MNARPIKQYKPGEEITEFFVIRKKEVRTKKSDHTPYLALELGNATGRISATIWDDVDERSATYGIGDLVKVQARVIEYRDRPSLVIEKIRKQREDDPVQPSDLLPRPKKDLDKLRSQLDSVLQSIKHKYLGELLNRIFSEEKYRSLFEQAAAGKLWHHNRLAGLLEHTLSMVTICDFLSKHYREINREMLITGALLHDIGKIGSYKTDRGFIEYTDEGRLIGHVLLGANWVDQTMVEIGGFPSELREQVLHLILSHHGELAHGAPVVPMTLEAMVLYNVDQLDSKVDALLRIYEGEGEEGKRWSNYVKLLDRFLYFPPDVDDSEDAAADEEAPS
jgi:3'-5' exoribonuclease